MLFDGNTVQVQKPCNLHQKCAQNLYNVRKNTDGFLLDMQDS